MKATNLGGVGSDVTAAGIAKRSVGSIIAHMVAGRTPVLLVIDREQRSEEAESLAASIKDALDKELASKSKPTTEVAVIVADRAFEAWILADAQGLFERGAFAKAPSFFRFEGSMGVKQEKGKADISQLLGRVYSETRDGPRLFALVDFDTARKFADPFRGSRSLNRFLCALGL